MENTWQLKRIKRIQEKVGKNYIKEFQDRFYISFEDLLDLLGDIEETYNATEEITIKLDKELNNGLQIN